MLVPICLTRDKWSRTSSIDGCQSDSFGRLGTPQPAKRNPRRRQGDVHEALGRLTAVFVKLASVALSQGWIGRAKVAHQAFLIVRRKASVTTPLHACVQGAIKRLSRSDRHVTLRIGSTEIGIVFLFRDQKNTNLVRDSTQSMRLSCFGPA